MNRIGQLIFSALAAITVFIFFQAVAGYWVQFQVEKKLNLKIGGDHRPDFARPSFRVENLKMTYREYFEVLSGNLKVRYNILPLTPDLLHVWIDGHELTGRLKGKLAAMPGASETVTFDRFKVEIKLAPQGIRLIAADIHSSVFEFKIQKSKNPKGQLLNA